jgi:very-long-chain enoyl-CoA reductase
MVMILIHFVKRELETLVVHRFSLATMPALNIFKNSGHYWALSGLLIAYFTYAPSSPTQTHSIESPIALAGIVLFIIGELGNLNAHLVLRDLRREGTTERGIPKGLGFNWVTCPNYLFETIAWVGVLLVNRSWSTLVFIVVAVAQMAAWAQKKERRYRKEFPETYKKKRYAMLPGIV